MISGARTFQGLGTYFIAGTQFTPNGIVTDGYPILFSGAGRTNALRWVYGDGGVRFFGCLTGLYLDQYQAGLNWYLYQDGIQIASYLENNNAAFEVQPITNTLNGSCHNFNLVNATASSGNGAGYLAGIQIGIGDSITASGLTTKIIEAFYGDSITVGIGATGVINPANPDARGTDSYQLSALLGRFELRAAVSGVTVALTGAASFGQADTAAVTGNAGAAPVRVWIRLGTNDIGQEALGTDCSSANTTFIGGYCAMLVSMRAGLSASTPIMAEEILPRTGGSQVAQNVALAAAVANYKSVHSDAFVFDIPTTGWINPATDAVDGLHPNAAGYAKIYNREIPIVTSPSYVASGPSGGQTGSPSANFTVAMANGATFTGDQTITISDGASGGTITPSVGSPGTSSVVVTPTNGLASFTFTYSNPSAGSVTLTFTNAQVQWTNPPTLPYTST